MCTCMIRGLLSLALIVQPISLVQGPVTSDIRTPQYLLFLQSFTLPCCEENQFLSLSFINLTGAAI